MQTNAHDWVEIVLWIWFSLTALSVMYVAWDLITRTPEMKVMKWGWVLVTLYTGPVAFVLYWLSCREPSPGTHEKLIASLWKQAVGSAIHCMAGDATGIIIAAAITSSLGLPMGADAAVEYVVGFAFGLLIFQALFMKDMLGGSYWQAVKGTWLAEWLSMNAVMAGMIPVMIVLMTKNMWAMKPTSMGFWGIMSLASLAGAALGYPVNWWLVKNGLKHGMGTERALGKGGTKIANDPSAIQTTSGEQTAAHGMKKAPADNMRGMKKEGVSIARKAFVAAVTVTMLAGGAIIAGRFGDLSMRASESQTGQMPMPDATIKQEPPATTPHHE